MDQLIGSQARPLQASGKGQGWHLFLYADMFAWQAIISELISC